jgi:hypothetical protein
LLSHYIRGYFDGNGCITDRCATASISLTSGSIEILRQLRLIFKKLGVVLKSGNDVAPICNDKAISYSGKNAKIILNWIYKDSDESTRLIRKYEKYIKFFKKIEADATLILDCQKCKEQIIKNIILFKDDIIDFETLIKITLS